jgi:predicted PurR-regulated permease PerM
MPSHRTGVRENPPPQSSVAQYRAADGLARGAALVTVVVLAFVVGALLLWAASAAILAILIAIVFAVLFDAGARALGYLVSWPRRLRLLLVFLFSATAVSAGVWLGGTALLSQAVQLFEALKGALSQLPDEWRGQNGFPAADVMEWLPSSDSVLGGATRVATTSFGAIATAALIVFLSAFFAWDPSTYKAGLLSLVPKDKRARLSEVLDLSARAMRRWMMAQSVSMTIIFAFSYTLLIVIGMPYPALLALQAGLLAFIPTLGAFVAGVVIVLTGLSVSTTMALYGLGVYLLIQLIESNLLTPLVQERLIRMPPGLTLSVLLIAAALFGLPGVAFAVPLAAAAKVMITELYVKDRLGGAWHPSAPTQT